VQEITQRDILDMVQGAFNENQYFQQLQIQDAAGCSALVKDILDGADGDFLWTAIVFNLLEDEIPWVLSVAPLRAIVQTTSSRLEEFFSNIPDTIKIQEASPPRRLLPPNNGITNDGDSPKPSRQVPPC